MVKCRNLIAVLESGRLAAVGFSLRNVSSGGECDVDAYRFHSPKYQVRDAYRERSSDTFRFKELFRRF